MKNRRNLVKALAAALLLGVAPLTPAQDAAPTNW